MRKLLNEIADHCDGEHQVILSTHSAFVLNKLGLDKLRLISEAGTTVSLTELDPTTTEYFMRLPGYDTLRLILARRCILVEGPSDELIVQRAYKDMHGTLPIDDGVDVISVGMAFKRFLEIAARLKLKVCVVTDNDGKVANLEKKYAEYLNGKHATVQICYDEDGTFPTLEPQLLKANSLALINRILGKKFDTDEKLEEYMTNNKTECAVRFFETEEKWAVPGYITRAIR
jgi:putative ATP-dependent endonuclease of the OLD family